MDARPLDQTLVASPQIRLSDLPAIAAAGYRSVISNRPDGEEPGQPTADQVAAAAREAGLEFAHVPVVGGRISEGDVAAFRHALDDLPGPVFGFCRSGTRTTMMWALANAGRRDADDLIAVARGAGYDLAGLRPLLTR